jgi:hypothetical protein
MKKNIGFAVALTVLAAGKTFAKRFKTKDLMLAFGGL